MKDIPSISDTEWRIMQAVWAHHPVTATEIVEKLSAIDSKWHPKTTRTLLARLVKKGALNFKAHGRSYLYEPGVTEEECISTASGSFLDRVFGGSLRPMLVHFVENRRISRAELNELRALLDEAERKQKPVRRKTDSAP